MLAGVKGGGARRRSGCRCDALSRECKAMTMSRQSTDTISSNWSHGEEGRESGLDHSVSSFETLQNPTRSKPSKTLPDEHPPKPYQICPVQH